MASPARSAKPRRALDLGLDPVEALVVDRVLEAGVGALDAVAVVALHAHHGVGDVDQPGRLAMKPMTSPRRG